jgi:hypothetical protein
MEKKQVTNINDSNDFFCINHSFVIKDMRKSVWECARCVCVYMYKTQSNSKFHSPAATKEFSYQKVQHILTHSLLVYVFNAPSASLN